MLIKTIAALVGTLAIVGVFPADATQRDPRFASYKVIPGGSYETGSRTTGYCGRQTNLYVFQVQTKDIYSAADATAQILKEFSAEPPAESCRFYAAWSGGIGPNDSTLSVTRWIPESRLLEFADRIKKLGIPQYVDEILDQGKFGPGSLEELKSLTAKLKLSKSAAERKALRDQIDEREREAASYRATEGKILVHISIVQPSTVESGAGSEPAAVPGSGAPSFETLKTALRDRQPAVRRGAAAALAMLAPASRGASQPVGGVGLRLSLSTGGVVVSGVIKDMPADKAQIEVGTVISSVDGVPTAGRSLEDVTGRVRGGASEPVTLGLRVVGQTSERTVKISRKILIPSASQVEALARDCTTDVDVVVQLRCWDAAGQLGARKESEAASAAAVAALRSPDKEVKRAAVAVLGRIWGLSSHPNEELTGPPRTIQYMEVPAETPCAGSKEPCQVIPQTKCPVLTGHDNFAVAKIALEGPKFSKTAVFPCRWEETTKKALFGPFCDLPLDSYLNTITDCAGNRSVRRLIVVPSAWAINLCLTSSNLRSCQAGAVSREVLGHARMGVRLDVAVSSAAASKYTSSELCSRMRWSLAGECVWHGSSGFSREAIVSPPQVTQVVVTNGSKDKDSFDGVSLSVQLDDGPPMAKTAPLIVGPGDSASGMIDVPNVDRSYPVSSADGLVKFSPPIAPVVVEAEAFGGAAIGSYLRQRLAPVTSGAYRIRGWDAEFVLASSAAVRVAVSPERSGAAIYRFDGVAWSSGAVSNQLFEPGRDGAAASVAGSIVRSGRYAVFSLGRDTRPPSTEFSITGGSRVASGIVLASTASFVVLRASDELQDGYSSQVATTYYRIDKLSPLDPFAVYKSSIPLSLGAHTIEYRSQDWMGNLEEVRTSSVVVTAGDVFKEERGRTVEGRLLVGFMDSGAQVEVESQAQSDHTFMVSGADGMPLMAADNIGRVSLGGARARAQVDVAANDLSIALQLRNGAFRSMPGGPQLALGYSYPAQMRHAIATDHGADPKDNGIDFMIWTPKLSSAAIATERFLSLQEMSWNAASFHVCPVGRADAEVEVSNLAAKGGGSMRRFELQTPAFLGPEPGEDIEELLRHKAYETVLQLRHASYTYPDDPSTRREGLLFKDAPESIRGKGGVVLLDTRVANLELALQESMKRLEGLKRRLAALRGHR